MPDPSALEGSSIAFAAYNALGELPKNAPPFELENGNPVVMRGEKYCRMPNARRRAGVCGAPFLSPGNLLSHIENSHGTKNTNRLLKGSRLKGEKFASFDAFYRGLMKDEEYEGKESGRAAENDILSSDSSKRRRRLSSPAALPSRHLAEQDDDEDLAIKQEDSQSSLSRSPARSPSLTITLSRPVRPREKSLELGDDYGDISASHRGSEEKDGRFEQQQQGAKRNTAVSTVDDDDHDGAAQLEADLEFELEEIRIKGKIQQLQTQLQEVQLRRKLAAMKGRRMQSEG